MIGVLAAERIKLATTRSPLWATAAVVALSMALAWLQARTAYQRDPMPPEKAALGAAVFGVPVLMVLASMTITGEYRTGMIRTTFLATPNRTAVLVRKAAGAVAVLLLWPLVVETVLGTIPGVGADVGPFLPFTNALLFTGVPWLNPGHDMRWGAWGSLAYFAAVCAAVFAAAVAVVNRRDA